MMEYGKLGRTGLEVSRICLGCMSYGVPDRGNHAWSIDEEDSRPFIKRALEGGINFFDTANRYSLGSSEEILGRAIKDFARRDEVVIATKVYGVAGDPVAQSLSPAIMNAAMRRENVNAVYVALHAKTLRDLLACVSDIPIHGLSITMPYKEAIVGHLDNTDSNTTKSGACNTVVRAQDGKLYGFNTDSAGILRPLEQRMTIDKAKILVLGAGGAARAAVFGLKERGAEVYILNRSLAPAQKLARRRRQRSGGGIQAVHEPESAETVRRGHGAALPRIPNLDDQALT